MRRASDVVTAVGAARALDPARTQVMLFATKIPLGLEGRAAVDAIVEAGGPRPRLLWSEAMAQPEPMQSSAVEAWAETTRQLLLGFLRLR